MEYVLFLVGGLALLIWLYLVFLRGGFWRAVQELYSDGPEPNRWPGVVVAIAAGGDAEAIEETLPSVLDQVYPGRFHVVLVDGGGGAAEAALRVAERAGAAERLTVVPIKAVPPGWTRRNWAVARAEEFAASVPGVGYLWLIEPWVQHGSQSLRDLVAKAEQDGCGSVSLLPVSTCERPWDRLLSPAFAFFFQAFHPLPWVNDPQYAEAAAAPGSTLVSTSALVEAGSVAAFKRAPVLETELAAELKDRGRGSGRGVWCGLGDYGTSIRPGDEWTALRCLAFSTADMQFRQSPVRLAIALVLTAIGCLAPPIVFFCGVFAGFFLDIDAYLVTFAAILLATAAWAAMAYIAWPTFRHYDQEEWCPLLLPLAALGHLLLTLIVLPRILNTKRRSAAKPAVAAKLAQRPSFGPGEVERRVDGRPRAAGPATGGHAFRQRVARP